MTSAVAPDRVLKELADLWVSLGKPDTEGRAGVLRACSMTLITVADASDDFAALGETIAALMPEHPARSIVVRLQNGSSPDLTAKVYSQCWMPFGQRRQICCEQVEVSASETELDDVAALLLPLCVPDLPVIVWGRASRAVVMPAFLQVAELARKVIVDSASLPEPKQALQRLTDACTKGMLIGDLAWTRLTRWREMIARLFDNREYQARVGELSKIRVECAPGTPSTTAFYMGAWVAGCLRSAGVAAEVSFVANEAVPEGGIGSVTLFGESVDGLRLALTAQGDALSTCIDGVSQCGMSQKPNEYSLLREELGIVRDDKVYRRTLSLALQLAVSS